MVTLDYSHLTSVLGCARAFRPGWTRWKPGRRSGGRRTSNCAALRPGTPASKKTVSGRPRPAAARYMPRAAGSASCERSPVICAAASMRKSCGTLQSEIIAAEPPLRRTWPRGWRARAGSGATASSGRPGPTTRGPTRRCTARPRTWRGRVLQDNADKFQHNKDLTDRRVKAVQDAGAFRAPTNAARSFNPQYGDVQRLGAEQRAVR